MKDTTIFNEGIMEVKFPTDIMTNHEIKEDLEYDNLPNLLNVLDKQVSQVDTNVEGLVNLTVALEDEKNALRTARQAFEEARMNFDITMEREHQKLNDLKIDFEQEKTRVFREIQTSREMLEKKKRDFEKYREEQLALFDKNKKQLTKNYEQFEKIVATFNEKIDKFNISN